MRATFKAQQLEIQGATTLVELQSEPIETAHSNTSTMPQDIFTKDYYEYSKEAEYAEGNAKESQMLPTCERSFLY